MLCLLFTFNSAYYFAEAGRLAEEDFEPTAYTAVPDYAACHLMRSSSDVIAPVWQLPPFKVVIQCSCAASAASAVALLLRTQS
eukprot:15233-Heterococcus_DN1.PRE.2